MFLRSNRCSYSLLAAAGLLAACCSAATAQAVEAGQVSSRALSETSALPGLFSRKLLHAAAEHAAAAPAAEPLPAPEQHINWIKGVAAAALFIEAMLGVALPLMRGVKSVNSALKAGLMSILNCFAGGVFITFGIMHLFGHVTEAQADSGYTAYFPIGVFLITLGFYLFFFIQRVLGPLLAPQVAGQAAGAGGASCCAAAVPFSKDGAELKDAEAQGSGCPCDENASCRTAPSQRAWAGFVSPALLVFAMSIHGIFEGLTLGIQDTKAGAITVLIALVAHKWVESIALSARCVKAGANWWQTAAFLGVFAITAPLGVGIGIALEDINAAAQMVLYALATGFFIYVGASEVLGEEFSYTSGVSKRFRCLQFLASLVGFALVALLQLIHDGD